uniref:Cytochrome b/b6 domain-containing protein n=1 Tax=Ammonifex degensii TaxID=42838 RepID=A0A7C2IV74_9THEO
MQLRHTLPARIFHWTLAPLAIVLVVSGFYITNPPKTSGRMRTVRQIHSLAGFLFTFGFIARVYYGILRRDWRMIVPERHDRKKLLPFLRYELFLTPQKPKFRKYNIAQKLLYTFWPLEALVILPLGFFLYAPKFFARPIKWLGGLNQVRNLVYYTALLSAASIAGHIYSNLTDSVGKLKSIFTGYYQRGT